MAKIRNFPPWLWWIFVGIIAIVTTISLFTLHGLSGLIRRGESSLIVTHLHFHQLQALEWRAIAKMSVSPELLKEATHIRSNCYRDIDYLTKLHLGKDEPKQVGAYWQIFNTLLDKEFSLIQAGDFDQARALDKEQVDPAFTKMDRALENMEADVIKQGMKARSKLHLISALLLIISCLLIGYLIFQNKYAYASILVLSAKQKLSKEAEEKLQDERNKLASIIEAMPSGLTIRDPDYNLTYQSPQIIEAFGNHLGKKCYRAFMNRETVCEACPVELSFQDGKTHAAIKEIKMPTGAPSYWENIANPIRNTHGEIIACLEINTDITGRRLSEIALHETAQRLQLALRSGGIGIWDWDVQNERVVWDERMYELYGMTKEAFPLSGTNWTSRLHPDDGAKTLQEITAALRGEQELDTEFRLLHPSGAIRYVKVNALVIRDTVGKPMRMIGLHRDMTERKHDEEKIRQQREELSHISRLATVGEFAASIAHEIHQPLTAILNNAQAAKRFLSSPVPDIAEVHDALADIINDDEHAAQVIHNLRTFLKRQKVNKTSLKINDIIVEVVALLHSETVGRNVNVDLDLSPALPLVFGSSTDLQQVLMNLILNACDAMLSVDSQRRRLSIRTFYDETNSIQVTVRDSGIGLDDKAEEHIFEPFYTTKTEGLGMGLSISKTILLAYGGKLWAENNPEGGATFYFTLPSQDKAETS